MEVKKIYVIASREYEANMPDLFLMDGEGNYYGASRHSYARWYKFPEDINYWVSAEGSDEGRRFCIDEVELPADQVEEFDRLTKEYERLSNEIPTFESKYPVRSDYNSKKAYDKAVTDYMNKYDEWTKSSNLGYYLTERDKVWAQRTRLFCSFSGKVYEAIKYHDRIKWA